MAACCKLTARGVEKAVASLPHLALLDLGHVFASEDQFGGAEEAGCPSPPRASGVCGALGSCRR